jgi:hypothetical protein
LYGAIGDGAELNFLIKKELIMTKLKLTTNEDFENLLQELKEAEGAE